MTCACAQATVICRNGLHIEHVSSGVSRDRKALLRNVAAMCKEVKTKADAKRILEQMNDSDAGTCPHTPPYLPTSLPAPGSLLLLPPCRVRLESPPSPS